MISVTVIIPNYNFSEFLDTTLFSVFSQITNFDVQVLVGDDSSQDQSAGILTRFKKFYGQDKFDFFINTENKGEVETVKRLLSKAKGNYIAYLDGDDYWIDPYKLQKQFDFLESNPEFSASSTGYLTLEGEYGFCPHPEGDLFFGVPEEFMNKNFTSPEFISTVRNCVYASSRFFRNYEDLFQPYFFEFPYSDWPMNYELSLRGKINYDPYPSYIYRKHSNSLTHPKKIEKVDETSLKEWLDQKSLIFTRRKEEFQKNQNKQ
jgi:glycosyltransferase involved in cell wall biosynthesis